MGGAMLAYDKKTWNKQKRSNSKLNITKMDTITYKIINGKYGELP